VPTPGEDGFVGGENAQGSPVGAKRQPFMSFSKRRDTQRKGKGKRKRKKGGRRKKDGRAYVLRGETSNA